MTINNECKMKKIVYLGLMLFLIGSTANIKAQVNIGSMDDPHSGAVLDLSHVPEKDKGLLLPKVELEAYNKFSLAADNTKESGKGMVVYNTNASMGIGVYVWDGKQWNRVDGQYMLSVSRDEIEFFAEGNAQTITIYTDIEGGWQIDTSTLPAWLHITSPTPVSGLVKGAAKNTVTLTLTADELATGGGVSLRNTSFYVEAGRLKKQVAIKQTDASELKLQISTNILTFKKSAKTPKTVTVTSIPVDAVRNVTVNYTNGTIGWNSDELGPLHYDGTNFTNLILQPSEGSVAGGTAVITISITNSAGMTATQTVNVVQLTTDYLFDITGLPADGYEATADGQQTVYVTAETSWQLGMSINPEDMLSLDTNEHPNTQGLPVPYNFDLAHNPAYTDRIATVAVTSSDPDWANITFPIKQKGTPPFLNLLTATTIDLDNASQRKIGFETNAGWIFTPQTGYTDVASGQAIEGGSSFTASPSYTNTGSIDATVKVMPAINLTLKDGTGTDTQIAGSDIVGTVKLITTNHTGYTPAEEKEVTVKRKAIERWDTPEFSPAGPAATIAGGETTVSVTAHTNMDWFAAHDLDAGQAINKVATNYNDATDKVDIIIPANPSFTSRTFHVWANKSGGTDASKYQVEYIQSAATLAYQSSTLMNGGILPRAGGDNVFQMTFDGSYTGTFTVTAYNGASSIGSIESNNKTSHPVKVEANNSWNERTITYQYYVAGLGNRAIDGVSHTQSGYSIALDPGYTLPASIAQGGGNITVQVKGDYPAGTIIRAVSDGTLVEGTLTTGSTSGSITLTIPANSTTTERTITIVAIYSDTTSTLGSLTQPGCTYTTYNGYQYAVVDFGFSATNTNAPASYSGGWQQVDLGDISTATRQYLYNTKNITSLSNPCQTLELGRWPNSLRVVSSNRPQFKVVSTGSCSLNGTINISLVQGPNWDTETEDPWIVCSNLGAVTWRVLYRRSIP
jgi:hypothetical protein